MASTVFRKNEMILVPFRQPGFLVTDETSEAHKAFIEEYDSNNEFILPPGKYIISGHCLFSLTKIEDNYQNSTEFEIIIE